METIFNHVGWWWYEFWETPLTAHRVAVWYVCWQVAGLVVERIYKQWYRKQLRKVADDPKAAMEFMSRHIPPKR